MHLAIGFIVIDETWLILEIFWVPKKRAKKINVIVKNTFSKYRVNGRWGTYKVCINWDIEQRYNKKIEQYSHGSRYTIESASLIYFECIRNGRKKNWMKKGLLIVRPAHIDFTVYTERTFVCLYNVCIWFPYIFIQSIDNFLIVLQ